MHEYPAFFLFFKYLAVVVDLFLLFSLFFCAFSFEVVPFEGERTLDGFVEFIEAQSNIAASPIVSLTNHFSPYICTRLSLCRYLFLICIPGVVVLRPFVFMFSCGLDVRDSRLGWSLISWTLSNCIVFLSIYRTKRKKSKMFHRVMSCRVSMSVQVYWAPVMMLCGRLVNWTVWFSNCSSQIVYMGLGFIGIHLLPFSWLREIHVDLFS